VYVCRSTPCPNVKQGDEWGDPSKCETGDACGYCHTRTEQQFHLEVSLITFVLTCVSFVVSTHMLLPSKAVKMVPSWVRLHVAGCSSALLLT